MPAAACSYLGDFGIAPEHYVLRADPVYLRTDTRGLVLFDASRFPFSEEESRSLSENVAEFLSQDGWHLTAANPQHWYLSGDNTQHLQTWPLSLVRGDLIGAFLPEGPDASAWLKRLNEIQMLMYTHPVNQERVARGLPVINSLWLWGGGELPGRVDSTFSRIYANDAVLKGLGRLNGVEYRPVPGHAGDLLDSDLENKNILLILDSCSAAAAYQELRQWNDAVGSYERSWFAPLIAALARRRIRSLELLPLDGFRYSASFFDFHRFWKCCRPYRVALNTS